MTKSIRFWLLPAFLLVTISLVQAQQPTKLPRIGYLTASNRASQAPVIAGLREGLKALGYIEDKNIKIEYRYLDGKLDQLPAAADELARLPVDVILTGGAAATRAAKQETTTIPIVMSQDSDPVGNGFIASLARPGGNITGLSALAPEISGKRLELLREVLPKLRRVAMVGDATNPGNAQAKKESESAAAAFKIQVSYFEINSNSSLDSIFQSIAKGRAEALHLLGGPISQTQRAKIAELAVKFRRPAAYNRPEFVEAGGLMSYGPNFTDLSRRSAKFIDKILKGTKPADIPVEQPVKFEFIVNLQAAKQIGLTIPPNVLVRADRVIR